MRSHLINQCVEGLLDCGILVLTYPYTLRQFLLCLLILQANG